MTILYDYWRSSAAYRVRIALNLLGQEYTSIPVDLVKGEQRSAENLARNPQGLVPTLVVDGLSITQSLAIIEYLNDRFGTLLPSDPAGRARVRALSYAVAMEIAPICNLSVRNHVQTLTHGGTTVEDWQKFYISKGLSAVEQLLNHPGTGQFCHGGRISMADICLVPQVFNALRVGVDVASLPRLSAIFARLTEHPAVAAAHPDKVKPT